jgi:hypothetical protein
VSLYSLQLLSGIFLTLRKTERNTTINVPTSVRQVPILFRNLMQLKFSEQIFKKIVKLHYNPSSGSQVLPRGQKDRQSVMTKLRVAFRSFSNAPNNYFLLQEITRITRIKATHSKRQLYSYFRWEAFGHVYRSIR